MEFLGSFIECYSRRSVNMNAKSKVTLKSGSGKNTASTLYSQKNILIWNNHDPTHHEYGDTAYIYNAQGKLASSKSG